MQAGTTHPSFDVMSLLTRQDTRCTASTYEENQIVYSQGDPAEFGFLRSHGQGQSHCHFRAWKGGHRRNPRTGRILWRGSPDWEAAAFGYSHSDVAMRDRAAGQGDTILGLLHREQEFAEYFLSHLLTRTARVEADLVDQLFNSSEMPLARALLLLANYGGDLGTEPVPIKVNQETLAALIGTTRSRVNLFMNKFRKLGLIDYNGKLEVRKALLNYVLNERPHIRPNS